MPLEPPGPRDRRALAWGAPVVLILLLYLAFRGDGESNAPPAEPATVVHDLPATYAQAPAAPVMAPPPVVVASPQVVVAQPVVVVPTTDVSQLKLVGLLSRGAVIAMADGSQRFIPIGREIVPGVILRRVEVHQAVLATGAGEVRLGFDVASPPTTSVPPDTARTVPTP